MATYNTVNPAAAARGMIRSIRVITPVVSGGGGTVKPPPTTGQIWPRGDRGS